MAKHKYRAVALQSVEVAALVEVLGTRVVVALDVGKEEVFAAVMDETERVHVTVKWRQPAEGPAFVSFVRTLAASRRVEVVMEPSSTYGDPVRAALEAADVPIHRVNPKRSHDASEVYDGVPSWHDAKSAAVVGKLHLDGASEPWPIRGDDERALAAALRVLWIHQKEFGRNRDRLEGLMARHWPELCAVLDFGSATCLELLCAFGGPAAVTAREAEARDLMRRVGGRYLLQEKIDSTIASAARTFGMPQVEEEQQLVRVVAAEARRSAGEARRARRRVEALTERNESAVRMRPAIGKTTAAVLVASVGDPLNYHSSGAYLKSLGLNLKEKSSGKEKGALHVTKRGPSVARMFLYMAALRMIARDPVTRAWFAQKVRRSGGKEKAKGVVAIMRKLTKAMWHVVRGAPFDSTRLFDVRRLGDLHLAVAK